MMRFIVSLVAFCLSFCTEGMAEQTSHLAFVSEYVRQLGANERMRELGEKDVSETTNTSEKLMASIRASTRIVLELNSQIGMLRRMHLAEQFDYLPDAIAKFYAMKVAYHERMMEMDKTFLSEPKEDVDYGALAADAPKITASVEQIDRSLFEATPVIFATLIDEKPDKSGHMSRLIVRKAERDNLARTLTTSFGKKLDAKDQNYIVSSASVLRHYLLKKGYKCADEPYASGEGRGDGR